MVNLNSALFQHLWMCPNHFHSGLKYSGLRLSFGVEFCWLCLYPTKSSIFHNVVMKQTLADLYDLCLPLDHKSSWKKLLGWTLKKMILSVWMNENGLIQLSALLTKTIRVFTAHVQLLNQCFNDKINLDEVCSDCLPLICKCTLTFFSLTFFLSNKFYFSFLVNHTFWISNPALLVLLLYDFLWFYSRLLHLVHMGILKYCG